MAKTAGIIVIGNEILSGKTTDVNSLFLARELRDLGVDVRKIAVIPDELLNPTGLFKERLSQSALFAEMQQVKPEEAREVKRWLDSRGMKFALGPTMVVRRDCLETAGGFRALGPYHADDFMLGNMIAASGQTREQAGQLVLQLSWFCAWMRCCSSTP